MEETGEWIIKENGGNSEVVNEVHSKINRAKSTIDEVTVKLNDRRRRLETALTEKQRVYDTFEDFGKRVVKLDKSLTRAKPVSAEFIVIKEQKVSHEVSICHSISIIIIIIIIIIIVIIIIIIIIKKVLKKTHFTTHGSLNAFYNKLFT